MGPHTSASMFLQFVPLIIVLLVFVAFAWPMTARKGVSPAYALLGFVPLVNILTLIWLASLPDKDLLERLARLEAAS